MENKPNRLLIVVILLGAAMGMSWLMSYYTDWLWFRSVDYSSVFWRMIKARFASGAFFGALAALVVGINLWVASRFTRQALNVSSLENPDVQIPGEGLLRSRVGYVLIAAVLVLLMGSIGAGQWPTVWRYLYQQPFGVEDPIFGRDVGFYVFSLPIYRFVANFLLGCVIVSALAVGLVYAAAGGIRLQ